MYHVLPNVILQEVSYLGRRGKDDNKQNELTKQQQQKCKITTTASRLANNNEIQSSEILDKITNRINPKNTNETTTNRSFSRFIFDKRCLKGKPETSPISDKSVAWAHYDPRRDLEFCHINSYNQNNVNNSCQKPDLLPIQQQKQFSSQSYRLQSSKINSKIDTVNNNNNNHHYNCNLCNFDCSRKILISERLLKTVRIWYLPTLKKENIIQLLNLKPNGNFILGYDSSEISAETHVNGSLLCKTNLILYVSNILIGIANHTIWIDENSYFCFDCNLLNRFKSIMSMLEYYLTNDEPKVEFKLRLPLAIAHAKNLQQLNSLSLLEQDFWLDNFYNKYTNQPATQTSYLLNRSDQELLESSKWPNSNNRSHTLDLKLISNYLNENQAHQSFENVHEPCEHIKHKNSKSKLQYQSNVKSTNQACHYTPDIENLSSSLRKSNKNDNKSNKSNSKKNKSGAIEKCKSFRDTSSTHCNNEPSCTSYSLLSKFSWPRRYLSARFKTQTSKNPENQLYESTNGQANNLNSQKFKSTPLNSSVVGPKSASPNSQSHINSSSVKVNKTNNNNNIIATNNNISINRSQALTCDSVSSLTGVLLLENHQLTSAGKSHYAQNQRKNNDLEDTISINSCLSFFDNHLKEINERRQSKVDQTSEMNLTEVRVPGSPALNGKHQTHDSNVGKKKTASSILNSYSIGSIGSPRFLKKKFNTVDKTSPSMSPPTPPPPPPPPSSSSQSTTWKLDRSQISNEYSEPFDLFISETPKNQYKQKEHASSNLETSVRNKNINSINNDMLTFIKNGKTTPTDDDSAYSSCVNQSSSNNSTPKTITKNTLNRIYKNNAKKDNRSVDNDEDTATSSMLFSSSSCSSSSPLSSNLTKLNVAKLVLPIYSEYESVKDSLIKTPPAPSRPAMDKTSNVSEKSIEEIKNDNDLFKSTITAFDILSERCSELIELFDENKPNQEVTVAPSSAGSVSVAPPPVTITYTVAEAPAPLRCSPSSSSSSSTTNEDSSESTSPPLPPVTAASRLVTGNYSKFLERTLTFDYLMKSSALLSSSSSLSPLASQTEPKTAVQTSNKLAPSTSHHNYLCSSGSSSSSASSSCSASSFDDLNTNNFNSIRSLIFRMGKNERCLFGKNVSEFLNCTNKSKEQNPNTLMSNIRQFMNGIKNYLIKNITDINNLDLKLLIEKERANLDLTQILNIDSLIEDCLQSIILRPLKAKIYYLLVDWLVGDNSLILISKNIKKINEDDPEIEKYLAFKKKEHKPSAQTLKVLRNYYNRMQCEYAPLIKLKYVLFIINELLSTIKDFESALNDFGNLNIIDFLPIIIYSLSKCGMYAIQIEIDYIWNLANRQLLTNETIYYLTLMSSACYILKSIDFSQQLSQQFSSDLAATGYNAPGINSFELNSLNETTNLSYMNMGLIDVYLPDDKYQTLKVKKIPVKPNSKCKEVCYLIASKFKIYNYDDYALYYIENGAEFRVKDDERPLEIKNEKIKYNPNIKFIFKQKALNLLWPKSIENF